MSTYTIKPEIRREIAVGMVEYETYKTQYSILVEDGVCVGVSRNGGGLPIWAPYADVDLAGVSFAVDDGENDTELQGAAELAMELLPSEFEFESEWYG